MHSLTLAFATLADAPIDPARRVAISLHVAASAGTLTAWWVDKWLTSKRRDAPFTGELEYINRSKTAALIRASGRGGSHRRRRGRRKISRG